MLKKEGKIAMEKKYQNDFLNSEIRGDQEAYEYIIAFIGSPNIRNGEYEGNEYIIKKIDRKHFFVFAEYTDKYEQNKEIAKVMVFNRNELIKMIQEFAKNIGLNVIEIDERILIDTRD